MLPVFASAIVEVVKNVVGMGADYLKDKRETAAVMRESEIRIRVAETEARIARLAKAQEGELAWDERAMDASSTSWKDEFWTIVLAIPAIMCFIPGMDLYVFAGFQALSSAPEWYRWALLVAVAASFGYRKLADFMERKA